jgi:tetrahydromethanopterin S-methyltransferase subunit G
VRNIFHRPGKALPNPQADAVFLDRLSQVPFPEENFLPLGEMTPGPRLAGKEAKAQGREVVEDLNQRIEAMHKRDVQVAWAFVIGLWCAMIFVAIATWNLAPSGGARVLLLIGGAVVLVFNTAAILAMLRHYREDRDFMYGLDIKFMDEATGRKG